MGHSEDDAVHKIPHKMKTHWQNKLKFSVLVWFTILYRTRYKKIDVRLVQCPFKEQVNLQGWYFIYKVFSYIACSDVVDNCADPVYYVRIKVWVVFILRGNGTPNGKKKYKHPEANCLRNTNMALAFETANWILSYWWKHAK